MLGVGVVLVLLGLLGASVVARSNRMRREREALLKALVDRVQSLEAELSKVGQRLATLERPPGAPAAPAAPMAPAAPIPPIISSAPPAEAPSPPPETVTTAPPIPSGLDQLARRPVELIAPGAPQPPAVDFVQAAPAPSTEVVEPSRATPAEVLTATPAASAKGGARRGKFEQMFIEHWTGILGAAVVVAGVTFTGIYAALRLAPFYRFLMTLAAAGALLGIAAFLRRKQAWRAFASWLRSAGAAILLFACAASGGLPGLGLEWIHAPLPALSLLLVGIAANLYIAFAGGTQAIATLHVLLSLLPLAIVPPSAMTLALASAVAIFGVGLGARGRWDRHLAVVLCAYVLFHVIWYTGMGGRLHAESMRLVGTACAVLVFGVAAVVHYREDFAAQIPSPLQVSVHLVNWGLLALAMFVYVSHPVARAIALVAFALAAWFLARRGRRLEVQWLYRADTLSAQALVFLALVALREVGASATLLLLFAFAETLAFRWLTMRESDAALDRVVNVLPTCAGTLLVFVGLMEGGLRPASQLQHSVELFIGVVVALLGQRVFEAAGKTRPGTEPVSLEPPATGRVLGWLSGSLLLGGLALLWDRAWAPSFALGAMGALLLVLRMARRAGLVAGALIALVGVHILMWSSLLGTAQASALALTPRIAPVTAIAGLAVWLAGSPRMRQIAIALVGADLGLAAFLYLDPVSPLIPGVVWLLLSLAALEAANRTRGYDAWTLLSLGYAYLLAFLLAYALVIIQTPAYIGVVSARLLIEVFALAVVLYWLLFRPRAALGEQRNWLALQPLLLEGLLAGAATTIIVEVPAQLWAAAWVALALLLLSPFIERALDARVKAYSLLFYWVSVADMAVVLSVMSLPSRQWYDRPGFTSLVAIGLHVAYTLVSHRRLALTVGTSPRPALVIGRFAARITARRNWYVYYPLFLGVAVFLYWRFDRSALTLLWTVEAFGIFALSAVLRENSFRRVAMVGLGACLIRLVVIDMSQANLGLRGVVFIGVGVLMLGMNAIYNRFRARFES